MKIRRKLGSTLSASKLAGSPRNFIFRTLLRAELFFKFGQRRWWLGVAVEVARAACGGGNCFRSWALSSRFNPNSVPPPNTHFTHPLQCHWPVQDDQANFLPDFNKFGSPTSPPEQTGFILLLRTRSELGQRKFAVGWKILDSRKLEKYPNMIFANFCEMKKEESFNLIRI